jgi:hypothetical protein
MDNQQYEFNPSQNELISDLATKMRFVAYFSVAFGVLSAITGLIQFDVAVLIQGTIAIIIGIWTVKAASSFKKIVDTKGNDIELLMGALSELRKLYSLEYWLLIIGLVFIAIALVLTIIFSIIGGN